MMDSLLGDTTKDIQRKLQKLSRILKDVNNGANTMGTNSDTEMFRNKLKNDIKIALSLCKEIKGNFNEIDDTNDNNLKIQKLKTQFEQQQQQFSQYYKIIKERGRQYKPITKSENNENTPLKDRDQLNANGNQQQKQEEVLIQYDTSEMERREENVYGLLDDLDELNEMFKDLNELVVEQGAHVDELQNNITQANDQVKSGAQHLDKAASHQKKARRRMCAILLILLIIVGILVIVFTTRNGKKNNNN